MTALEKGAHEALSADFQKYNQKMRQLAFNLKVYITGFHCAFVCLDGSTALRLLNELSFLFVCDDNVVCGFNIRLWSSYISKNDL